MGDHETMSSFEGEEELIAAAEYILKALETNQSFSNESIKVLVHLGAKLSTHLSSMDKITDNKDDDIEDRLNTVYDKVMNWEMDQSMIWDSGPEESNEYVKAVEEINNLIGVLENQNLPKDSAKSENLRRAHDVLQTAMSRVEEEFRQILVHSRQPFEPEHMSFRSNEEDVVDEVSFVSFGDDSVDDVVRRESLSRGLEDYLMDLVNPDVIPDLKCIANLMFDSNYGRECTQTFVSARKEALDDCLLILEVEKASIEDVLRMEWGSLNSKIRRWIWAMKIFVRVYLASEKWLSDQIFSELDSVSSSCFIESSKGCVLQLLNFGEAIAIGPHKPEKLLRILDMYEVLDDLIPDIESLYPDEIGSYVRHECQDVLKRLGDCVKATFLEFENLVASNVSVTPFASGGTHHLTKYVMNYTKTLTAYNETLDFLLKDQEPKDPISYSPDTSPISENETNERILSPMELHFRFLTSILENNLVEKSKLYKDDSLKHLFLMNNIHYMAEKVKASELRTVLGDGWIRKHNGIFQQHAMNYERATWSSILSILKDDGLHHSGSKSISKTLLKEKFQRFYHAFEEVYKSQSGWSIPDSQLREDLRISTSLKVIQAYRTFIGRHSSHISDKYIKYSADDLENFLLDFFEGSPRSIHSFHKK